MSDGCAGQYKNCYNFTNLCHHDEDFGIPAEWHFFATSHGKSPADGIARTVKRTAAKASLQRPYKDQILTPKQLFEFVSKEIIGIHFAYATSQEYEEEAKLLKERFSHSKTIPGTQSYHSFIPKCIFSVEVKPYSKSTKTKIEKVTSAHIAQDTLQLSTLKGYVTVAYEENCWLGQVVKVDLEARLVEVNFLHPKLPAKSYFYPQHQDILEVDPSDILSIVNPTTQTGRRYYLTLEDITMATMALKAR